MTVLDLDRIGAIRADPRRRTRMLAAATVDRSLPFVPETQTQLYFTPGYRLLSRDQRIRYNQLFGLRMNEYIMMLERDFVEPVLAALRSRAGRFGSAALVREADAMRAEEAAHYEAFAALNRQCEPALYRDADTCFMRLKPYERTVVGIMNAASRWLPFALWIVVAMEELSIALATEMARSQATALGRLDPHFVAVHREHAKDEARHIHIDVHLVRACLHTFPPQWRACNAWIFKRFMRDMTAPKVDGTGARVLRRLIAEFPALAQHEAELLGGLTGLRHHREFQYGLMNRRLTPLAFSLYDEEPAFADLGSILKGYDRPVRAA